MNIFSRMLSGILVLFSAANSHAATGAGPAQNSQMTLSTNAYAEKMAIPVLYTCDGKDVSPQLTWSGVPAGTETLAIIMKDPDAPSGTFYHWIAFNLQNTLTNLPQGAALPAGAREGKNDFGNTQYNGPCPPKGKAHRYIITLYALNTTLDLPQGADAQTVLSAMKNHIIGQVDLAGVYSRWNS
jgi:Raf kinase inhibitor-like YbhB/YbcL family protein